MPGSRSNLDVYLRLHGQRKFAKEVTESGAELEAMGLKGARSMAAFAKSADKLKSFGRSWTRNVSMPIAGLAAVSGYMAVNFKRQMGLVATDAGGTAKEVERLEKSVLGLARESQFGPQKLAESLFHVESAGFRGAKAMRVLRESQKLATTGNSDLEETTYALVSANKALYGESVKHVHRTAAELNGIVAHGDMRLEELVGGLGSGLLAKAKAMGLSLRDVGAALDVMTARGIKAERASYALGFTMQKLVPYGEKAEKAFGSIGLGEETLIKASQHGKYGYVTGLEVLQKHLDMLPTKAQQTKVIEEMFGGGRMTSGLLTDLQNLGEMKKIYGELGHEVTIYNKHAKEASEQPKVELEEAWSSIQASLIEIGDELVPVIVPAVKKLAHYGETAAKVFMKIPGPVKAIGLAGLVLVGPVASALGYFASGIGRSLVLMAKLGRVMQNVQIFGTAMKAGMGVQDSASIAFNGFGKSAALQTAKGFAYSLGPAVAAYGIGNIVTSATSGDWKDAGFEAGGAMAGGIAGFMLGGPMGAMLGVGIGSLGGELLSGLFKSTPKVSIMRRETEHLTDALGGYKASVEHLTNIEHRSERTTARHTKALKHEREARNALAEVLARYGVDSGHATRAQKRLSKAERAVTRAAKAEARMHELSGFRLKEFRIQSLHAVASIKQLLPVQKHRIKTMREEVNHGRTGIKFLNELEKLEGRVGKEKRKLTGIYAEAEEKGGKPWAERLHGLTTEQAKYGRQGQTLVKRLNKQRDAFKELVEEGAKVPLIYKELREEIKATAEQLGTFNANTEGIGPARLHSRGAEGKHHPTPQRIHPNRHAHGSNGSTQARRLSFTKPGALHINAASPAQSGSGRDINVTIPVNLDGREVARSTAKVAKDEALLQ